MTNLTDIEKGDQVFLTSQPKDFFFVETSSDGLHGFEWMHFVRTQLVEEKELTIVMSDCRVVINGRELGPVQKEFMEHKIALIGPAKHGTLVARRIDGTITVYENP